MFCHRHTWNIKTSGSWWIFRRCRVCSWSLKSAVIKVLSWWYMLIFLQITNNEHVLSMQIGWILSCMYLHMHLIYDFFKNQLNVSWVLQSLLVGSPRLFLRDKIQLEVKIRNRWFASLQVILMLRFCTDWLCNIV